MMLPSIFSGFPLFYVHQRYRQQGDLRSLRFERAKSPCPHLEQAGSARQGRGDPGAGGERMRLGSLGSPAEKARGWC